MYQHRVSCMASRGYFDVFRSLVNKSIKMYSSAYVLSTSVFVYLLIYVLYRRACKLVHVCAFTHEVQFCICGKMLIT